MQTLARLERLESRNRRVSPRRQLSLGAVLPETGDEAVILDLSSTGILIETDADLTTFEQLQLDLPEAGTVVATVMWNSGRYYGCEFHRPLGQAAVSAAMLRSPFEGPQEPAPSVASALAALEEAFEAEEDDRYPLGTRLRFIFGASILTWALILGVVATF